MEKRKAIKSYVLRAARMSKGQKEAIERLSSKYCIEFNSKPDEIKRHFQSAELCIEIGFGMGHATVEIAMKNPSVNYLGIEVHKPGVGRLLSEIERNDIKNLKIINHDAVEVLNKMIEDSSVSGFHIFFPDPWPKKKHHKRRLIKEEFVYLLSRKLILGGYIYAATDWEDYAEQMLSVFNKNRSLNNEYTKWADSPVWRPQTSFEKKGINKSHIIRELYFKRVK